MQIYVYIVYSCRDVCQSIRRKIKIFNTLSSELCNGSELMDCSRVGFSGLIFFFFVVACFLIIREFVNNVWYIKILSPHEVQQMGKEGLTPATSVPSQRLTHSSNHCDDYMSRQDLRSSGNGLASMGSLEY